MLPNLEKAVAVRLAILEEQVQEMERLLRHPGEEGSFRILVQDLPIDKRRRLLETIKEILRIMKAAREDLKVRPSMEEVSALLAGMAHTALVSCLELEPGRMKGYGGDPASYTLFWEKRLKPLKGLFQSLVRDLEEARASTGRNGP